jgi:tetratricopeptide (TPR) repeat protein
MKGKQILGCGLIALASTVNGAAAPADVIAQGTQQPAPVPSDPAIEKAMQSVREGKVDEALGLIRETAAKHPEWPPPRLILARMHFAANQAIEGRRALERAAFEAPDDPRIFLTFASIDLSESRVNDARLNAEKALSVLGGTKLDADAVRSARREAHASLAAVAEAHEAWQSARTHLLAVLEDDPKNGTARQRLGRALFRLGKTDDAYKEFAQAVIDDPKIEPAAISMALLSSQTGNIPKATEWFDYAAQVEPKSARVRIAHARWLIDQGKPTTARPLVEEAAKLEPTLKDVEALRGLIAWYLRELPVAERVFEALNHSAPADTAIADLLALTLVEQDDSAKKLRGLQLAEMSARQAPQSVEAIATLGWAHYRSGHLDEASRLLRAAVSSGRASGDTAYFLARVLADQGQTDSARKLLTAATSSTGSFAFREDAKKLLASLTEKPVAKPASSQPERPAAKK